MTNSVNSLINPHNRQVFKNFIKTDNKNNKPIVMTNTLQNNSKSIVKNESAENKSIFKKVTQSYPFKIIAGGSALVGAYIGGITFYLYTNKRIAPVLTALELAGGVASSAFATNKLVKAKKDKDIKQENKAYLLYGASVALVVASLLSSKAALNRLGKDLTGFLDEELKDMNVFKALAENIKRVPESIKVTYEEALSLFQDRLPLIVPKSQNKEILQLQKLAKNELGLGKVYLGEYIETAKEVHATLKEIQNKGIADLKGLNVVVSNLATSLADATDTAGAYCYKNNSITLKNLVLKPGTIYHEVGHYFHYKKAPDLWNAVKNQQDIFPAILPENVRNINVKNIMDKTVLKYLQALVNPEENMFKDIKDFDDLSFHSYSKNNYLQELFARTFVGKRFRDCYYLYDIPERHMYLIDPKCELLHDALCQNNVKEFMKEMVNIIFDEKTCSKHCGITSEQDRNAFVQEIIQAIKY